jgi:hypothetical protein
LDPAPLACLSGETGISVHTSRFKFSVTVVGLPSGKVYELSDSQSTTCVDKETAYSLSFQTYYESFDYFYQFDTDSAKSGSSSSKGATVVYTSP